MSIVTEGKETKLVISLDQLEVPRSRRVEANRWLLAKTQVASVNVDTDGWLTATLNLERLPKGKYTTVAEKLEMNFRLFCQGLVPKKETTSEDPASNKETVSSS